MLTKKEIKKIEELNKEFHVLSLSKTQLLKIISETEVFEQVYNSNAIENSTLSIEETEKILLQIDLDRYVSEREIFEAKNLARIAEYINNNATKKNLDKDMILFLHKILISNIDDSIAGRFRKEDEFVKVANHIAPAPKEIDKTLEKIFITYKANTEKNIVHRVAKFHLSFEKLHPFIDGNGRIGRTLNNYLLIRDNFVPINIRFSDRLEYYNAFKEFNLSKEVSRMEKIVYRALVNSFYKRIAYLKGLEIIALPAYAKRFKLSHPNLINKAKRQTIPAFREKGTWKIGVDNERKSGERKMKTKKQRWKYRFDNFKRAYILLQEATDLSYENKLDQLGKEGMIQRFEYTTELAYNTIKDYLESQNIVFKLIAPRAVIKEAVAAKFIERGEEWMNLIDARNKMSHRYNFDTFEEVIEKIKNSYLECFDELYEKLLWKYDDESDF